MTIQEAREIAREFYDQSNLTAEEEIQKIKTTIPYRYKHLLADETCVQETHDAIVILTKEQEKLGYVPEKDETIFARLMDAGKLLKAKVTKIERKGSFTQISIGIYLVDF